jgi:hypothetical protein
MEDEKELFHAALGALESAMADSTIRPAFYSFSTYPYIFQDPAGTIPTTNWASYGDTSLNSVMTGKPNMGAIFNLVLLEHDPGAFAHNSLYSKLLIFDSIDWLDNNTLDGTIDLALNPDAAVFLQGDESIFNDSIVARPAIY